MKPPTFWYCPPGLFSTMLSPLGWIYEKGSLLQRHFTKTHFFSVPIISVGNLVCGGAGKTPTAIALARLLKEKGLLPHFVTRGYGGSENGPLEVILPLHTPHDVGDEALLLAQEVPTWVSKKRHLGIERAVEKGAHCIILDDGHQTRGVHKDLSFVVTDPLQRFGNEQVLPAGPLRENLQKGLLRADALMGSKKEDKASDKPFFKTATLALPLSLPSKRVLGFCGLGFPEKFFQTLKRADFEIVGTHAFPDHYVYTKKDLETLHKKALEEKAHLVTTRKDQVKIPSTWQVPFYVLDITIQFEDPEGICHFIFERIPSLRRKCED